MPPFTIDNIQKPKDKPFENTPGNKRYVYFALLAEIDITTFPKTPENPTTLAEAATITDPITFISGGRFYKFENTVEKPKLMSEMVGETDGKGWENKGTVVIPGNTKDLVGFLKLYTNADFIIIFQDMEGNHRLLGTPDLPANFSTGNMDSGDAVGSTKATTLELRAPGTLAPFYEGAIPETPAA
jgi:hypothetical protein